MPDNKVQRDLTAIASMVLLVVGSLFIFTELYKTSTKKDAQILILRETLSKVCAKSTHEYCKQ